MSGEHNTLAGARLDPNASSTGPVGSTMSDEAHSTATTGETATADSAAGNESKGFGSTVLSYMGLSGSGSGSGSNEEGLRNVKEYETAPPTGGSVGTGFSSGVAGGRDLNDARDLNTGTSTAPTAFGSGVDATGTEGYSAEGRQSIPGSGSDDRSTSMSGAAAATGTETDASAAPEDTRKMREVTDAPGASDSEPKEGGEERSTPPHDSKPSAKRENDSAIPIAGGERLGEKHWGESKIVPDNPKPQTTSSEEGQPDKSTKENTDKNTGGASGPPGSQQQQGGEAKEGLADKIKHKLGR